MRRGMWQTRPHQMSEAWGRSELGRIEDWSHVLKLDLPYDDLSIEFLPAEGE